MEKTKTKNHEYLINGTKFIVNPVFKPDSRETVKSILLNLMLSEIEKNKAA